MTYRNCRTAAGPTGYGTLRREAGAGTGSLYAFVSETGYGSRDGTGYAPVIDAAIFASGSEFTNWIPANRIIPFSAKPRYHTFLLGSNVFCNTAPFHPNSRSPQLNMELHEGKLGVMVINLATFAKAFASGFFRCPI
jgi:hypothetical protein